MAQYDSYARFYDATQGAFYERQYLHLLRKYHAKAESLLEIACGTGCLLMPLSKHYQVAGLDISGAMLKLARQKMPDIKFYRQSMAGFQVNRPFDAIICPYDSINHLLTFGDWVKTFRAAKRHLNLGGVFIFDINTEFRLKELAASPTWVHEFDGNTLMMNVSEAGKGVTVWDVKVFERESAKTYRLHHDLIKEISFPLARVRSALKRHFDTVRVFDVRNWSRPKKTSRRLFFLGRRKSS